MQQLRTAAQQRLELRERRLQRLPIRPRARIGMNFPIGVSMVIAGELDDVLVEAEQRGIPVFELATAGRGDRDAFFRAVRESLPLYPQLVSSQSWDALSDSLWEGLSNISAAHALIVWREAPVLNNDSKGDFQIAVAVLRDVAESLSDPDATVGNPKRISVYVVTAA